MTLYLIDDNNRRQRVSDFKQNLNNIKFKTLSSLPTLLALSACGGSSAPSNDGSVNLSKSGSSYSITPVQGLALKDPSSSIIEVSETTEVEDSIRFQANGVGIIEFDFIDTSRELAFAVESKISGFNGVSLKRGSTDFTNVEFVGAVSLELSENADIKIGLSQLQSMQTIVVNSLDSKIEIVFESEEELNSFLDLVSSSSLSIYAEGNPFVLTTVENSDISKDLLSAKAIQAATYTSDLNDAPDLSSQVVDDTIENGNLALTSITFEGNPTGNVTVILDKVTKELLFSQGGITSNGKILYEDIDVLSLPSGATLELKSSDLEAMDLVISGEGNLVLTDVDYNTDLTRLKVTGSIKISGEAIASDLLALDLANANKIDVTGVVNSTGIASDLKNLLDDQTTIQTASNISLLVSGAQASLSDLKFVAANTSGFVNAIVHSKVTGSVDDGYYVLSTEKGQSGDKIQLSSSVEVEINDDAGSEVAASKLAAIGASTTGDVTVLNALSITGSVDDHIAALDTIDSKVTASTSDVKITSAVEADYLSKIKKINDATSGDITLSGSGASTALQGSASDLQSGLSGIVTHSGSVTISEALTSDGGKDYLAQLKAINASTSGIINLTGTAAATELNGSADDLQAALSGISSHTAGLSLTSASTSDSGVDYLAKLKSINASTSGLITLTGSGASTELGGSASDLSAALFGIDSHTGNITVSAASTSNIGIDYLTQLKAINSSTSGLITLIDSGSSTTLQGSASDLNDALNGITTHVGNIIINFASASATEYLSQLKTINSANSGTISLAFSGADNDISGSSSDIIAALHGINDYIGTATVTTRVNASDASDIASKSRAVFSTGIEDSVANLVNTDSSDISSNLQSALSDDPDANIYLLESARSQSATDIELIESSTTGFFDLGLVNEITLTSGQQASFEASTMTGKIVSFDSTDEDGGEKIVILGTNSDDIIDLSKINFDSDNIPYLDIDAGTSGDDVITGSSGNDVILGRYGADEINLGSGGSDHVVLLTTGDGAAAGSPNGSDTVTGFLSADDLIIIGGSLATTLDGGNNDLDGVTLNTTADEEQTLNLLADDTYEYLILTNGGATITPENLTDTTEVATVFEAEVDLQGSSSGRALLLALESTTNGTFGLYYFADTDNGVGTIDPEEISVMAVVSSDDLTANIFAYDLPV